MQFEGKPRGTFRDDTAWNPTREAVEFTLDLSDDKGNHPIRCRVSGEALQDAARAGGPLDRATALRHFEQYKSVMRAMVDRKLKAGEFEEDGSILIRSADLRA